jgi:N-acetylneuraminic acid mutarotase
MHVARSGFGAALVGEHIIVVGGEVFEGGVKALSSVEAYHPALDNWTVLPSLPVGVHGTPVASLGRTIIVLGGSDRAAGIDNRGRVFLYTAP